MIEKYSFYFSEVQKETPRELMLLSIISQGFVQPFSLEDNLLVLLTALTSGSGVGFNRAMLFLKDGDTLRGEMWLGPEVGPGSAERLGGPVDPRHRLRRGHRIQPFPHQQEPGHLEPAHPEPALFPERGAAPHPRSPGQGQGHSPGQGRPERAPGGLQVSGDHRGG